MHLADAPLKLKPKHRGVKLPKSVALFGVVELRRCEAYEHFRSHPVLLGTLPRGKRRGRGMAKIARNGEGPRAIHFELLPR